MSDDLAAFLAERLAEEELFAREAFQRPWRSVDNYIETPDGGEIARFEIDADARFASGYEPARVLREVEAKRAILAEHAPDARERGWCSRCRIVRDDNIWVGCAYPCPTLLQLAAVYSDHLYYRPEWAVK